MIFYRDLEIYRDRDFGLNRYRDRDLEPPFDPFKTDKSLKRRVKDK